MRRNLESGKAIILVRGKFGIPIVVRRLKIRGQTQRVTSRRPDGVAGEQAAKVDDVEDVVEVLSVNLKPHIQAFGFVDVGAGRRVDLKTRIDAATREVDAAEDLRPIFGQNRGRVAVELERQAGVVLNSAGDPEARHDLIAQAAANGVALVLGIGEVSGELRFRGRGVIAEEQASGDRQTGVADDLGVTRKAGKTTPLRQIELGFRAIDAWLCGRRWES